MTGSIDGLRVRAITTDEFASFAAAVETAFADEARAEDVALWRRITELDRTVAVFDDARIVGTGTADSLHVTVPGGERVAMAGVTAIGVLPTHRRRGLLTGMMRRLLDDARGRGEPLAGLWASESAIYGRFGFGWAISGARMTVDTRRAAFAASPPAGPAPRLLDHGEIPTVLPQIYEAARPLAPGMLSRSDARWAWAGHDPEHLRDGASRRFAVALGDSGYALYRIKHDEDDAGVAYTLIVEELVAADDHTLARLWRYLLDVDLVTTVRADNRPVDDPLPLLLADPRQAVTHLVDTLWLRVLDVPAALAARSYAAAGSLVFTVHDPNLADLAGTYILEVRHGRSRCTRTGEDAELTLGAADLGAIYLGGTRPSRLARAGRVVEHAPGALARADDLFAATPAPWCPFVF